MQAGFDGIRTRMGNVGLEFYKHVFLEGTLLFLLAGCLLANQLTYSEGVSPQGKSIYYEEYLTDAEGPINASIDSYLSYAKEQAQGFSSALEGVMQMEERVEELRERAQQEGIVPWLVNQEYYEGFWGDKPMPLQRQNMVWMLLLVLCSTSGLVAYERQEGTLGLLRSLSDGRKRLFRRKVGIRLLTTTLIWGFFTGMEVWTICSSEAFQPNVLGAAVQNMDFLQDFPFRIRIGSYMLLLYGLRLFVLLCVAILASWIGSRMSTLQGATLVNLFILGFPALLYAMEVEAVQSITVLPLLSGNEFLRSLENIIDFWPVGLCAAAGILAYHLMKRSWVRN